MSAGCAGATVSTLRSARLALSRDQRAQLPAASGRNLTTPTPSLGRNASTRPMHQSITAGSPESDCAARKCFCCRFSNQEMPCSVSTPACQSSVLISWRYQRDAVSYASSCSSATALTQTMVCCQDCCCTGMCPKDVNAGSR